MLCSKKAKAMQAGRLRSKSQSLWECLSNGTPHRGLHDSGATNEYMAIWVESEAVGILRSLNVKVPRRRHGSELF